MTWSTEPTWGGPPVPPNPGAPPPLPELPPELKPKTGRTIAIAAVCSVLVCVLGFGGLVAFFVVTTDASRAQAGDCIDFIVEKAPGAGELIGEAAAQKIDCEDADAAYEVGVRLDDPRGACPGEAYAFYFQEGGPFGKFKLCLIPNVAEGDCFVESQTRTDRFACTEGKRTDAVKVLRVVKGTADENRCADIDRDEVYALTYPAPPRTICFEPFGPSTFGGPGRDT